MFFLTLSKEKRQPLRMTKVGAMQPAPRRILSWGGLFQHLEQNSFGSSHLVQDILLIGIYTQIVTKNIK